MAEFFSTRGIAYSIDEIIQNGKSFIYLVTPYLKFSNTLYERLKVLSGKNVELIIVYGKTELTYHQKELLNELNCSIYFKDNLHAKCYANETEALVCSMNLHSFSEVNNIEMGIKVHHRQDKIAYEKCIDEIKQMISNSNPIREIKVEKKPTSADYGYEDFLIEWFAVLQESFPGTQFEISENKIATVDFPLSGIQFSNSYGFSTFELSGNHSFLSKLKDKHQEKLYSELRDYRCYWSSPFNRICLYHEKGSEFNNVVEDTQYCLAGTRLLIEQIRGMFPSK